MNREMKNIYWTLFAGIDNGNGCKWHKFPFSTKEKADEAFDKWIAKANESLGKRLTGFNDLSVLTKEAELDIDEGKVRIDVSVGQEEYEIATPLDIEFNE